MPVYEYQCTNCGLHFERIQRVSDDPIEVCPNCAGRVRRVISPVGIIFKGSGFYVTDNRRSSAGTARKDKSSDSASSNGKVESSESSASTSEQKTSHSTSEQEKSHSKG